jgi:AGCS family alanine or glycine:cation symporter
MYVVAALTIISWNYATLPSIFAMIFEGAFTTTGATGGLVGSSFMLSLQYGLQQGIFSNEAGQGSAPIAHAAAKTEYPVREGLVALMEPLIDTIIICTMTALVILSTGAWTTEKDGAAMTYKAFEMGLDVQLGATDMGGIVVSAGLLLFAFTTAITWCYYGDRCVVYLFGRRWVTPFHYLYALCVFFGAVQSKELVWKFVWAVVTIMAVPNLIALIILAPVVAKMTKEYFAIDHKPYK